ncbi:cell wall integrity/stress response component-like protein [Anaeramoeba flamelloides]|uniref:Cell wall integrity/stress response component-like protein n=1 Tax=Anaeramoeba flamelloides TaxID=1746091 RepID=A0AAV7YX66_9EUKA|nr:cell wall integrity/stress response component-like protein [Anaeramoeba flamelloides]
MFPLDKLDLTFINTLQKVTEISGSNDLPIELLKSWLNKQISIHQLTITNLSNDLVDCNIFIYLMHTLCPEYRWLDILLISDTNQRTQKFLQVLQSCGTQFQLPEAEDINNGVEYDIILLVANLFIWQNQKKNQINKEEKENFQKNKMCFKDQKNPLKISNGLPTISSDFERPSIKNENQNISEKTKNININSGEKNNKHEKLPPPLPKRLNSNELQKRLKNITKIENDKICNDNQKEREKTENEFETQNNKVNYKHEKLPPPLPKRLNSNELQKRLKNITKIENDKICNEDEKEREKTENEFETPNNKIKNKHQKLPPPLPKRLNSSELKRRLTIVNEYKNKKKNENMTKKKRKNENENENENVNVNENKNVNVNVNENENVNVNENQNQNNYENGNENEKSEQEISETFSQILDFNLLKTGELKENEFSKYCLNILSEYNLYNHQLYKIFNLLQFALPEETNNFQNLKSEIRNEVEYLEQYLKIMIKKSKKESLGKTIYLMILYFYPNKFTEQINSYFDDFKKGENRKSLYYQKILLKCRNCLSKYLKDEDTDNIIFSFEKRICGFNKNYLNTLNIFLLSKGLLLTVLKSTFIQEFYTLNTLHSIFNEIRPSHHLIISYSMIIGKQYFKKVFFLILKQFIEKMDKIEFQSLERQNNLIESTFIQLIKTIFDKNNVLPKNIRIICNLYLNSIPDNLTDGSLNIVGNLLFGKIFASIILNPNKIEIPKDLLRNTIKLKLINLSLLFKAFGNGIHFDSKKQNFIRFNDILIRFNEEKNKYLLNSTNISIKKNLKEEMDRNFLFNYINYSTNNTQINTNININNPNNTLMNNSNNKNNYSLKITNQFVLSLLSQIYPTDMKNDKGNIHIFTMEFILQTTQFCQVDLLENFNLDLNLLMQVFKKLSHSINERDKFISTMNDFTNQILQLNEHRTIEKDYLIHQKMLLQKTDKKHWWNKISRKSQSEQSINEFLTTPSKKKKNYFKKK